MKYRASLWLAALVVGACLSACAKDPEPPAENATPAPTTTPGETTANAGGTTTYYGTPEEETQRANN